MLRDRYEFIWGIVLLVQWMTGVGVSGVPSAWAADDAGQTRGATSHQQPNILLIMTDQQHAEMMSCTGNADLETPYLDGIAEGGIRFVNAYVTNPVCTPSRISMVTGLMPGRVGVEHNGMRARISPETVAHSLGRLLKQAGYDTFYGGKVHLPPELQPIAAGYDEYFPDQRDELPTACVEFIQRPRDRPFFAVASFINPHDICFAYSAQIGKSPRGPQSVERLYQQACALPLEKLPQLPTNFAIPYGEPEAIELLADANAVTPSVTMRRTYDEREWRIYRWIYCRLTEQVDLQIGQMIDALERSQLDQQTLIAFTSDHGDMDSCHRLSSKGRFYERSVRVPFLLKYPGRILPGRVDDRHLVSTGLDLLPTLCDYAGAEIPAGLFGRSLRPIAEGKVMEGFREYVVSENHTGRMVRSQDFKYCVYNAGDHRESLVDLRSDPGELTNLALRSEYAQELNQHRRLLDQWIKVSGDLPAQAFAIPPAD